MFVSSSAGFAWIPLDRLVNAFQSTGPTLAWRRQRSPHTEGVGEGLSGYEYVHNYTHPSPRPPPPRPSFNPAQLLSTQNCSPPAALRSHPRCLASFSSLCCSTRTHSDWSTRWTKWNVIKRITKMLLHIWRIFLACLCACSLSWAFLLTEKSHGLKLFSYRLNCSLKECLCLGGFL